MKLCSREDHARHDITSSLHNNQRRFWRWLKNIRGSYAHTTDPPSELHLIHPS